MDQHIRTANHQERLLTSTLKKEQLFLNKTQQSNCTGEFNQTLTEAMISADIPFWKLQNVCFHNFLKRWTARTYHVNLYFVKSTSKDVMILRWILLKVELKIKKSGFPFVGIGLLKTEIV